MIAEIVDELLEIFGDGIQWKTDIISVVGLIMSVLQKKRELKGKGKTKARIVELVLQELLDRMFFDEDNSKIVAKFIVEFLPGTLIMLKNLARSISSGGSKRCWCF